MQKKEPTTIVKNINNILIVGDVGSCAYPLFLSQIPNLTQNGTVLWIDNKSNEKVIKNVITENEINCNIDVVYQDAFKYELLQRQWYEKIFINYCNLKQFLDNAPIRLPFMIRITYEEVSTYNINFLKDKFDLIILANPIKWEKPLNILKKLLKGEGVVEQLNKDKIGSAIIIMKNNIKVIEQKELGRYLEEN